MSYEEMITERIEQIQKRLKQQKLARYEKRILFAIAENRTSAPRRGLC